MLTRVVFLLTMLPRIVFAISEDNGRGARPIALANAFVAVANDPWSASYNPAGLARVLALKGSLFLAPEQFGLAELRRISAAAAIPLGPASAGLILEQFGFKLYRETTLKIGVGKLLDEGVAGGLTVNLVRCSIERYGSATRATLDAGFLVDLVDDLHVGFDWKNVGSTTMGASGESFPQVQSVGISYDLSTESLALVELEKDIRHPFVVKAAIEQRFLDVLEVRFGVSNNPDKFSIGFGVHHDGFEFSYAGYSHSQLGWTHQIEVSFALPR